MTLKEWRAWGRKVDRFLHRTKQGQGWLIKADLESWVSGGCNPLATALVRWLRPAAKKYTVWVDIWEPKGKYGMTLPTHVIVKVNAAGGEFWLDGEGVYADEEEVLQTQKRWFGHSLMRAWIEPYKADDVRNFGKCDAATIREIEAALRAKFGTPTMRPVRK